MATRFYLPSTSSAAVTVSNTDGWLNSYAATAHECDVVKISSAFADNAGVTVDSNEKIMMQQYVSKPIAAQTINGTIDGFCKVKQLGVDYVCNPVLRAFVVSNDGTTVRGNLLVATITNTALDTVMSSKIIGEGADLTEVVAQANDRIVLQIGGRADSYETITLRFGDDNGSDYTVVDDTTDKNPWIEFSQTITFASVGGIAIRRRIFVVS